jgi:hypothetical protein
MKLTIRILGVSLVLALVLLGITSREARADFIVDPDPGGVKFFIGDAYKDVSSFTGNVGGQNSGPQVSVDTIGNVDTGAGYANIKPVKDSILTKLTFTPDGPNLFGDFSFRGQLDEEGTVTVKVWDNQGNPSNPFTFTFDIDKANQDFDRIGIIAKTGTGETIKSVVIESDGFKEVKQIDFSYAEGVTPIPEPTTLLLLGSGLIGLAGYGKKKFFKK